MNAPVIKLRQSGIAAVELALILILSSFILPVVFLFARVFYHYNVVKQATQDAVNAMASTPRVELITSSGMTSAKARSVRIVRTAIESAGIKPPEDLVVEIYCNGVACVAATPVTEVRVFASFTLFDGFWQDTRAWLPDSYGPSWTFSASSDATYQN